MSTDGFPRSVPADTAPDSLGPVSPLEEEDPFREGAAIGPVWVVQKRLGRGGMGSVYRCHNRHAPRMVAAIKLLDPSFQFNPEARVRFLREAEILSTVDHPNVVRVASVNLDVSPPFLEMDFVEGESLEELLGRRGAFEPAQAVDFALQLADALRYLHLKRIYHRDVKPGNVVVTPSGTLKLVDFGLAVQSGGRAITAATTVDFGTVSYCPPEWGSDQVVEPIAWDLYALGVVLYEMLTGTVAFPASAEVSGPQRILQVVAAKRRLPHLSLGRRFHPGLREAVRRLTAREPSERYPDAKAAIAALDDFDPDFTATETPIPATEPPASREYAPPSPPVRIPRLVPLVGLLAVVVVGALLGFGAGIALTMLLLVAL